MSVCRCVRVCVQLIKCIGVCACVCVCNDLCLFNRMEQCEKRMPGICLCCTPRAPIPSSLLRPSSPCCPSLLLYSLAGIPPVQHKRYAKLFIRIAPQGELKGAGQARGVQQFKKICETVCVSLCMCVCVSVP